jgi:hypothetical protein
MLRSLTQTLRGQILILTALFVCSLPLVTPRIYASDEVQYFAYLRSLWFDRDVSFENEYQHFYDAGIVKNPDFHETFLERTTDTGRRNTFATMGSAILWSPFYAVADVIVRVRGDSGSSSSSSSGNGSGGSGGGHSGAGQAERSQDDRDQTQTTSGGSVNSGGYSAPYIAAVAYGSAVYGWLSLVLSLLITRRVIGTSAGSLVAAVAVWVGTPLFFYMYIAPPMAHACSAFAVSAFVLTWLRIRGAWSVRGMLALGALAALMAMVREQDVFIAIGPAVDFAVDVWRARGGRDRILALITRGFAGAAAFVVAYAPQLMAYRAINGYFGPSRLVARKLNWMAPHAFGVLLSPEHGLLFWTPLVLLSLAGLAWLALRPEPASMPDGRRIAVCLLLMVLSQIYIAGSVESWTVAGAFGQRRFVALTSIFVTGLAIVLSRVSMSRARVPMPSVPPARVSMPSVSLPRGSRIACAAAVAFGVWWNLGLMAQFGAGLMDRQRLELGRNAYQTFITIPARVPDLAYRYLFARGSFYKPAEPPREQ